MTSQRLHLVPSEPSRAPRHDAVSAAAGPSHIVQFYENEHFLAAAVSDFLAAGLVAGQPCLVIATDEHRTAIGSRLAAQGHDVTAARNTGLLTFLDARQTLSSVTDANGPNARLFRDVIGQALDACTAGRQGCTVRAFGEMVDLLVRDGDRDGALRLEELWNAQALTHSFTLLCAYSLGNLFKASDEVTFAEICRSHAHVIPTERYTEKDEAERLVEISRLQQRAAALENEIERRQALEIQLRAALSEAEAANRAKSDFLAVMSHELRTPLNAIAGHISLIELGIHGPVTEAQQQAIERVNRSQRHLLTMINDLMNLAKLEAGQVHYSLEEVAVDPMVASIVQVLEPLFEEKEVRCEVRAPSQDAEMIAWADRDRVEQILLNIFMNAMKYTPKGGSVIVEMAACSGHPPRMAVAIRDDGIGIEPDKLETIFEPFVQLGARCSSRDGVGLGLAISRDLARGMDGELSATSVPGKGSTFTLTLPRVVR